MNPFNVKQADLTAEQFHALYSLAAMMVMVQSEAPETFGGRLTCAVRAELVTESRHILEAQGMDWRQLCANFRAEVEEARDRYPKVFAQAIKAEQARRAARGTRSG